MQKYLILPCHEGTSDFHFKVYSSDLKTHYGNFSTEGQAYKKIDALRKVEFERSMA